jgi:DNA-binding response OmpR family regulator
MNECPDALAGQPANAPPPPPWYGWRGSGRILVIEDDDSIRTVLARSIARFGFTVDLASDGQQAIAQFESGPALFTLVFLDFKLPGMDGSEVLSRLRQIRPDVRVILMSGLGREEALEKFAGQGLAGFLQKPFALGSLFSELRAALPS